MNILVKSTKRIFTSCVLFICSFTISGQVTTFLADLNAPESIIAFNNTLYIGQVDGSLLKVHLSDPNPSPELVLDGMEQLIGLEVYSSYLVIADWGTIGQPNGEIYLMDLNDEESIELIAEGLSNPNYLKVSGNYLYFSETNGYTISRINLSLDLFEIETVISNGNSTNYFDIDMYDNHLYYIESESINGSQVVRLKKQDLNDLNEPSQLLAETPTSILSHPIGLHVVGSQLLICDNVLDAVFKLDLGENDGTIELFIENVHGVRDCLYVNDNLYMVEFNDNEISVVEDLNLSIAHSNGLEAVRVYPNPTTDYIFLPQNYVHKTYELFNLHGQLMNTGTIDDQGQIDLSWLSSGTYLLTLEHRHALKVIKN